MARLGRSYPIQVRIGRPVAAAAVGGGAVTFDAVGPSSAGQGQAGGASPLTWSHTCSGSDRVLLVGVVLASTADAAINTTVTYNGVAMTSIAGEVHTNAGTAGYAELFYLVAPATGANTVAVTITGATVEGLECGSVSLNGVDQTTPIAHQATATGSSASASVAVASATGNMVVDLVGAGFTIGASNQASRWVLNRNGNTGAGNGAQATADGAASVTMTRAISPADLWAIIAVDVAAAVGAAGQTISPTGIASGQIVGDHDVVPGAATVATQAVPSGELVGAASVTQIISPAGIPSGQQVGFPRPLPYQISGLTGFYDATTITGLADNAAVPQWNDISGNTRHATQATGTLQPTFQTNELNGNPVVRFDGTGDYLATAAFTSQAQPVTIFVAIRFGTSLVNRYIFDGITTTDRLALFLNASSQAEMFAGVSVINGVPSSGETAVYTEVFNTTSSEQFKNGTSTATGNAGGNAVTGLTIAGRFNGVETLDGDIGEIIVYNRVLTTTERQSIETYLQAKWIPAAALQTITPTGIPSAQAAGNVSTTAVATVAVAGIVSAERAGNIATTTAYTVAATGIPSAGAVGQAAVSQAITAVGIPSAERHGTSVATTVAGVTINATGIPSAERVSTQDSPDIFSEGYGPFVVTLSVVPSGVPTSEQFGNSPVTIVGPTQTITATGIPSTQALGTALTGQAIAPVGTESGQRAGNPAVTPGAVTLPQTGISSAEAVGNAFTAIAAPQVITAAGIATAQALGITQVAQSISVAGIRSSERFGNAVATPGVVSVAGTGIPSQQIFGVLILNREGIPDAILASTNLTGSLVDVQDDPLSPDANYLTAIDPTSATDLRVSFPTPFLQPSAVGGPKTFRVYVRRTTTPGSPDPTILIDLWESGVFKSQLASVTVTSTSGQLIQGTMNPADLTDPSGAGVELRVRGVPV